MTNYPHVTIQRRGRQAEVRLHQLDKRGRPYSYIVAWCFSTWDLAEVVTEYLSSGVPLIKDGGVA